MWILQGCEWTLWPTVPQFTFLLEICIDQIQALSRKGGKRSDRYQRYLFLSISQLLIKSLWSPQAPVNGKALYKAYVVLSKEDKRHLNPLEDVLDTHCPSQKVKYPNSSPSSLSLPKLLSITYPDPYTSNTCNNLCLFLFGCFKFQSGICSYSQDNMWPQSPKLYKRI